MTICTKAYCKLSIPTYLLTSFHFRLQGITIMLTSLSHIIIMYDLLVLSHSGATPVCFYMCACIPPGHNAASLPSLSCEPASSRFVAVHSAVIRLQGYSSISFLFHRLHYPYPFRSERLKHHRHPNISKPIVHEGPSTVTTGASRSFPSAAGAPACACTAGA